MGEESEAEWWEVEWCRPEPSEDLPALGWGGTTKCTSLESAREAARDFMKWQRGWKARITHCRGVVVEMLATPAHAGE